MKPTVLLASGLALCAVACGDSQPVAPPQTADTSTFETNMAIEPPADATADTGNEALISHMHRHSEQLKRLNDALTAGDLDAALSPAYWLSRHEGDGGIRADWQPQLAKMRAAAHAVEAAPDLATARAAAQQIADSCNGCHSSAGVDKVVDARGRGNTRL